MNKPKPNIVLVGFMGTGKTTVGRALASKLGRSFIETDALVEQKAGKTIARIFSENGEIAFREMEIGAVKQAAAMTNAVIACGGGVVLNRINIDRLKTNGVIVLLTATRREIMRRTAGQAHRPLLLVADRLEEIGNILKFRRPFYERAAEITVKTSRRTVESIVDEIVTGLKA
jgi:shikimate kinase